MVDKKKSVLELAKQIYEISRAKKISQKEIAKRVGETQQMVSRLLFLQKSDFETKRLIEKRKISKTAMAKIIDKAKSKTKNRTQKTKLLMLKKLVYEYAEEGRVRKNNHPVERKLDSARLKLVELHSHNFMLKEEKKELEDEKEKLFLKIKRLNHEINQHRLSLKNALNGATQKPKTLSPDLQYLAQNVSSNLGGVRVDIEGERILLDCMTEDFRDQTLEKLSQ